MEIGNSFLFHNFVNADWLVHPAVLEAMKTTLFQKLNGQAFNINQSGSVNQGLKYVERFGNVGVLSIEGVLVPKASWVDSMCGFTSTKILHSEFETLVNDPSISRIVLNIDSPGGMATGIKEFSNSIFEARNQKEIVGYVDNMACSAGYWLLSACENIVCNLTSTIGSIGTYIMIMKDIAEKQTSDVHIFSAGKKKLYGSPKVEITEEEIQYFNQRVKQTNDGFLSSVARNRNVSIEEVSKLEAEHFYAENAPSWMYSEIGDTKLVMS